jgi:hypothetical protein
MTHCPPVNDIHLRRLRVSRKRERLVPRGACGGHVLRRIVREKLESLRARQWIVNRLRPFLTKPARSRLALQSHLRRNSPILLPLPAQRVSQASLLTEF